MKAYCILAAIFALNLIAVNGCAQWVQQGPAVQCMGSFGPFYQGEAAAYSPDGGTVATSYRAQYANGNAAGVFIFRKTGGQWIQQALLPVSSTVVNMALSSNGNTVVVHFNNDSINIFQYANNTWKLQAAFLPSLIFQFNSYWYQVGISYSGNVMVVGPLVYVRNGAQWVLQANLRPYDRPVTSENFCDSTNKFSCYPVKSSISADGKTIVIGDNYDPDNNQNAWVFTNDGAGWHQAGSRIEATNNSNVATQNYGGLVVVSGDGKTIAMSTGGQNLCMFSLVNNVWTKQANGYLVNSANNTNGYSICLNYDGTEVATAISTTEGFYVWTLNAGVWSSNFTRQYPSTSDSYDSMATLYSSEGLVFLDSSGTQAFMADGYFKGDLGGAWAFTRNGNNFSVTGAEIFGTGMATGPLSEFTNIAMSADGSTLAVGDGGDNGGLGSVWVFARNGAAWVPIGPKIPLPDNEWQTRYFGTSVALSGDGSILAVGAPTDNNGWVSTARGNVFTYKRSGQTYVSMADSLFQTYANLGTTVHLSNDGLTLLTGDYYISAWVYSWTGVAWVEQGHCVAPDNEIAGAVTALSGDGNTVVVGDPYYDNDKGNINIFNRYYGNTWYIKDTDLRPASLIQNESFPSSLAISSNGNILAAGININNNYHNVFVYTGAGVDSTLITPPNTLLTSANDSGSYSGSREAMSATGDTLVLLNLPGVFNGYKYTGGHWVYFGASALQNNRVAVGLLSASANLHFVAAETGVTSGTNEIDIFVLGTLIDSLLLNKPATCPQSANGEIVIQLRGGTAPYHYAWSNGGPDSAAAVNLLPGTYRVTITDAGTDTLIRQYTVTATNNPVADNYGVVWNCTLNTGSISLNVSGGHAPYTYTWSTLPIQHTDTATGLSAGNYAYTVTDSLGCTYSDTATLNALQYWAQANATAAVCGVGGTAKATMYGTAPYTYLWSNTQTTDSISAPGGGSFTVTITDANGCTASAAANVNTYCDNIIEGRAFFDKNNNCVQDIGEAGASTLTMIATNGTYTVYGSTDSLGNYVIETPTTGNYTVSIAHWQECSYPVCTGGTYPVPVTLTSAPDTARNANIPLVNPGIDLTLQAVVPQPYPGSSFNYTVYYGNLQDSVLPSGSVTILYDSLLKFNGTTPAYTTLDTVNHIITFNVSNIGLLYPSAQTVTANFTLPANVLPHTILPMQSFILPDASDCNPLNNFITIPIYVAGSLDPNSKVSYPENRLVPGDSVITYTIHFQNVGNDSTHFIQVVDTLQSGVDPASVVTLSTSTRPYTFSIKGRGIVSWLFNPLALPDSASDPTGSQGYVTFQVKTVPGLALGSTINNTASIYFDYNAPVQTNNSSDTLVAAPCHPSFATITPGICQGDTFYSGNKAYTAAGSYTDTLSNVRGCDSVLSIALSVAPRATSTLNQTICAGQSFMGYNATGNYNITLQHAGANGCDSVVALALQVTTLNPTATVSGPVCSAEENNATYQWIDCTTQQPVSGATLQSFTALQNGSYRCVVLSNNCSDTTNCVTATVLWVEELYQPVFNLYPDPNNGEFVLQHDFSGLVNVRIYNMLGSMVYQTEGVSQRQLFDITALSAGVYEVKIATATGRLLKVLRVVKQ